MSLDGVGERVDAIEEVLVLRRKVLEHQLHFCVLVRLLSVPSAARKVR